MTTIDQKNTQQLDSGVTIIRNNDGSIRCLEIKSAGAGYTSPPDFDLSLGITGAIIDYNRRHGLLPKTSEGR